MPTALVVRTRTRQTKLNYANGKHILRKTAFYGPCIHRSPCHEVFVEQFRFAAALCW